ncbi:MAG: hypothetical protein HYX55_03555 [Chloroflexi bacterium]|nr:hypothetical protein [Chloroflexota bacterium]
MTVDQTTTAWEAMLEDANAAKPAETRPSAQRSPMVVALRTTVLLVLATLAILVLLPALVAAQATFVG